MNTLSSIRGVGPTTLLKLNQEGIHSVQEVLTCFPIRYHVSTIQSVESAILNTEITLKGIVTKSAEVAFLRTKLTKLTVKVVFGEYETMVVLFNREFLKQSLQVGVEVVVQGRFERLYSHFVASNLTLAKHFIEGIIPIYPLNQISDKVFRSLVKQALDSSFPEETLPDFILSKRDLLPIKQLLPMAHFPENLEDVHRVQKRIKYEELFHLALALNYQKQQSKQTISQSRKIHMDTVRRLTSQLPFSLTEDQKQCVNDIFRDFKQPKTMNRIVQGDVGSGKTVVALYAILGILTSGKQVALMAPTEILAKQHEQFVSHYLQPFGYQTAFLSSSLQKEERRKIEQQLLTGKIHVAIGTHALFQESVSFHNLGLVIIDEQHRFGVKERTKLFEKGEQPDFLMMTATPIPRTLARTMYAEMDLSMIKQTPFGEKQITTKVVDYGALPSIFHEMTQCVTRGEQGYIVVPAIHEQVGKDHLSVKQVMKLLSQELPQSIRFQALHGEVSFQEKANIIEAFKAGQIDFLVSTTVIEVGVDNQNATLMVILDCDRFGLSQLHQLRGRVGRGTKAGLCYLVSDQILLGNNRFSILEQTLDGFLISEEDLKERGPGEMLGLRQTGIPSLKMANIVTDFEFFEHALEDAKQLLNSSNTSDQSIVKKLLDFTDSKTLQ